MPELTLRPEPKTVQYFVEDLTNETGLDMVLIPKGKFLMGSPEDEPQREDSEGPQHLVNVPAFFMGRYPITQAQWKIIASYPKINLELNPNPSEFKGDNRPVEQVNWHEVVEFCARLSAKTSRPYRLPSEAEWEYACRARTTTPFYFGKTLTINLANYYGKDAYNGGPEGKYREETTPVDHFKYANAFGLHDMHGNVLEWCQDTWHDNYTDAPEDGSVWSNENDNNSRRVLRGGSWDANLRNCRSATRGLYRPDIRLFDIGFRVVCSAPSPLL